MKFNKLKVGEVLSETQFYTVDKTKDSKVQLSNDDGESIVVTKEYAEKFLTSSNQFTTTKKLSRTELTDKVMSSPRIAMTVNFDKQLKPADVINNLVDELHGSTKGTAASFKKKVKAALDLKGENRTMVGRHYSSMNELGRLQFTDMKAIKKVDAAYDSRQRLVDPRTLNWAIINGVKYEVK